MSSGSYRDLTGTGGENYERYFVPTIATPVSADLLETADLRAGQRVLDVACGTGVITRLAADRVGPTGSVTGIDLAPDMIDVAKTTTSPSGAPVDWHVGDAASVPFPDNSYDVVLCQVALMFMADRPGAVAEMRRALAPGGRLVVNTPGHIQPAFEVMEQAIVDNINPELGGFVRAVFSMHDPDALAELLRDAGLQDVSSTVSTVTLELPPPAAFLWQYINATPIGPIVAQAPDAAKSALERQVVDSWPVVVVGDTTRIEQPMVLATARK